MSKDVAINRLIPWASQPRKHFNEAALADLTESVRKHGVLSNLIVRPEWAVGAVTESEITARCEKYGEGEPAKFGIVSGERRFRAAQRAGLETVPMVCKPLTDPDAMLINLSEQIQHGELTPLEEGAAFQQMLDYLGDDGQPLHTADSLAAGLGKDATYVINRIKLLDTSSSMRTALEAGTIPVTQALIVARIPLEESRAEAAKAILTGGAGGGPMTVDQTQDYVATHYMRQLKGAPFNQDDALLVPAAGSCTTCPKRTGNNPAVFGEVKRGDICTDPTCFLTKCQALHTRRTAELQYGKALTAEESAPLFQEHAPTLLRWDGEWVDIEDRPDKHLLKSEVKTAPTWGELSEKARKAGMSLDVVHAIDGAGHTRTLVKQAQLVAAAPKLGEPVFAENGSRAPKAVDPADKRITEEREKNERQLKQTLAGMAALQLNMRLFEMPPAFARLLPVVLDLIGHDGLWLLCKLLGLKTGEPVAMVKTLLKHTRTWTEAKRCELFLLAIVAPGARWSGIKADGVATLAEMLHLDLAKVTAEPKPAKVPKPKRTAKAKKGGVR